MSLEHAFRKAPITHLRRLMLFPIRKSIITLSILWNNAKEQSQFRNEIEGILILLVFVVFFAYKSTKPTGNHTPEGQKRNHPRNNNNQHNFSTFVRHNVLRRLTCIIHINRLRSTRPSSSHPTTKKKVDGDWRRNRRNILHNYKWLCSLWGKFEFNYKSLTYE